MGEEHFDYENIIDAAMARTKAIIDEGLVERNVAALGLRTILADLSAHGVPDHALEKLKDYILLLAQ